ncbi:hypothetical protein N0V84_006274 [Fusarium piperis]|uniref:Necrosis and ethylene inducing peptide 1 n=1 Tax=Fusarium piperis TaxID=1435070 RepID=A0A9W8WC80_9HYPO|nr:hypothetical protein N0V84_006274 [Fusarium piperis]
MRSFGLLSVLATLGAVSGTPVDGAALEDRAVVSHDSLRPWLPRTQGGAIGKAIERFQPLLHIAHGCQPYTAVAENGDTSGGLQDTGNPSAGCRDQNRGQTYVRAAWNGGKFGIMYAWYFPKDQPNAGNVAGGHRHDWENVVVWIDNPANANPKILGVAPSAHGGYKPSTNVKRDGDRAKIEYYTSFPYNHALQQSDTKGTTYWVLQWESMTAAARTALQNTDFGSANVPFKNGNFESNLGKARL